jgi:hypothetical protein
VGDAAALPGQQPSRRSLVCGQQPAIDQPGHTSERAWPGPRPPADPWDRFPGSAASPSAGRTSCCRQRRADRETSSHRGPRTDNGGVVRFRPLLPDENLLCRPDLAAATGTRGTRVPVGVELLIHKRAARWDSSLRNRPDGSTTPPGGVSGHGSNRRFVTRADPGGSPPAPSPTYIEVCGRFAVPGPVGNKPSGPLEVDLDRMARTGTPIHKALPPLAMRAPAEAPHRRGFRRGAEAERTPTAQADEMTLGQRAGYEWLATSSRRPIVSSLSQNASGCPRCGERARGAWRRCRSGPGMRRRAGRVTPR